MVLKIVNFFLPRFVCVVFVDQASTLSSTDDLDAPSSSSGSFSDSQGQDQGVTSLVNYVKQFDQETVKEMARVVSKEGSDLIERQSHALFGDINSLQTELQVRAHIFGVFTASTSTLDTHLF